MDAVLLIPLEQLRLSLAHLVVAMELWISRNVKFGHEFGIFGTDMAGFVEQEPVILVLYCNGFDIVDPPRSGLLPNIRQVLLISEV